MIGRLRRKFIALSVAVLAIMLAAILVAINVINYSSVVGEADGILSVLSQNDGKFPDKKPPQLSPEAPYESRYFSVTFDKENEILGIDIRKIASVDEQGAKELALSAVATSKARGFIEGFRFVRLDGESESKIIFLDCGRSLDRFYLFLYVSVLAAFLGLLAMSLVIFIFSGRIIKPIAEAYEKQKRFITDASHEIKTPLAVINANAELLEAEYGNDESVCDIKTQTRRLAALTEGLLTLARLDEMQGGAEREEFPFSEIALDSINEFHKAAQAQGKYIECDIAPLISIFANKQQVKRLIDILLDNAVKYTPLGGKIGVRLCAQGRGVTLSVVNEVNVALSDEQISRLFDRFYRAEPSRNSSLGGHGIGLSVAKAIADAHNADIRALCPTKNLFEIRVDFNK